MSDPHEKITVTIKCTMKSRWMRQFLSMLAYMQQLGSLGASRIVGMVADGDGDFQPKFEWDADIESDATPSGENHGARLYDAG